MQSLTTSAVLPFLLLLLAGSCESHPDHAEAAPVWSRTCEADTDCVLVERPCVRCGEVDAVSASERERYVDHRFQVRCDREEPYEDCGDTPSQRAACEEGRCAAVSAD